MGFVLSRKGEIFFFFLSFEPTNPYSHFKKLTSTNPLSISAMSVVINPENPYVLNPFFFANQTNSTYDQTWIAFIHRSNNILAAALGFITCSLVIYLVLNRTPVPFKPYSKIVLLCSCVDFYFLLVDLLTHQVRA